MTRPIRYLLVATLLAGVAWASFAGGQRLRRVSAGPILHLDTRISALPEAGLSADLGRSADQVGDSDPSALYEQVLEYVRQQYVDRVKDESKLGYGSVRTMLASLDDPKTRFYDPAQLKVLQEQAGGRYRGIGAIVTVVKQKQNTIDRNKLTIVAVAPGGPADKAGLKPGDVITELDSRWVIAYDPLLDLDRSRVQGMDNAQYRQAQRDAIKKLTDGMSLPKALDEISTKEGQPLKLTVERAGSTTPVKVSLVRAAVSVDPVELKPVNDRVAYLRVTQFSDAATQEFTRALQGAAQRSIVLDLRDNASGPVTASASGALGSAKQLFTLLAGGGQMAEVARKGNRIEPILAPNGQANRYKVAVLVNGGTSNLAEVVAAALNRKAGAKLVGSRTFGDSVYQRLVDLRGGGAMTLRAGKLLAAGGNDFGGKGIEPTIAMATGGPRSTGDPAVDRAANALGGA